MIFRTAIFGNNAHPVSGRMMRLAGTCLLLIAVLFAAVVPQGMMRVAGTGGPMLVLCSTMGPQELSEALLDLPYEVLTQTEETGHEDEPGKCLAITLALTAIQSWSDTDIFRAQFPGFRDLLTSPRRHPVATVRPNQPRAPPVFS